MSDPITLLDEANDHLSGAIDLRRQLHQWPETGNDLPITRDAVLAALEGLPLDISLHEIDVRHRGDAHRRQARARPSCCAATWTRCRCRRTPTSTSVQGRQHDARVRPRHPHRDAGRRGEDARRPHATELAGRVLFMFQPGEEGHHGAKLHAR